MSAKRSFQKNILSANNQSHNHFSMTISRVLSAVFLLGGLLVSSFSFGQTGPAGVNANIKLWLDASDLDGDGVFEDMAENGVSAVDSSITEWRDKSGVITAGSHFTVPSPSTLITQAPKYRPFEANFGGLNAVEFNTNSALYHDLASTWNGAHTVIIVFKQKNTSMPAGTSLFSSGIDNGTAAIDDHFQIAVDSMGTDFYYYTTSNFATTPTSNGNDFGTQAAAGNVIFYTATRSGTNNVSTYVNGVVVNNNVAFPANGNVFDQYILNANRDTTALNDTYIAEVIVYSTVLTPAALNRVHSYLNCKYITQYAGPSPGGVDPCGISLWLKADPSTLGLSGTDVDSWTSQSNNSFAGTETNPNRPIYVASDNNFNPSISFDDGSNQRLSLGDSPALGSLDALSMGTNAFSIYAVAKAVPGENGALFSDNRCVESSGYRIKYDQAINEWVFDGVEYTTAASPVLNGSASVGTNNTVTPYALINFKRNGSTYTIQTHEGDIGTSSGTSLSFLATNDVTQRWVGKRYNSGGTCSNDHFDGNISELIIVRNTVTNNQDKRIQSYLGLKYGLTIPSSLTNYLASDGLTSIWTFNTYWNDVAGLGEDSGSTLDQRVGKSQHPSAIITMATGNDFTTANNNTRAVVGDGNYLVWGNNNVPASNAWTLTGAPADYAILPLKWRVKKTGSMGSVYLQVDVDDADNNMPTFQGDLYLVHGTDLSVASPVLLTETSAGIWSTATPVNFSDSSYFTFAVKNDLRLEFATGASSTIDETTVGTFTSVLIDGTVNISSTFSVNGTAGGTATNGGPTADYNYSNLTYTVAVGEYDVDTIVLTQPVLVQDPYDEGLETANFQLALGSGFTAGDVNATSGAVQIHIMTITDDDSYQVGIGSPTNGAEGGANATFTISMVNVATNTSGAPITGTISYGGTASAGSDFTAQAVYTIAMGAASTTVNLPIQNDSDLEGTESIIATITAVGAIPSIPTDTTYITDDEAAGLEISVGSPGNANEGAGPVTFTVSLSSANLTGVPITGNITYGTGTAVSGTDFTGTTTFSISNGASFVNVSCPTTSDNLVELTESVIAIISNPSLGSIHSTNFTDTAYIFDEDTTGLLVELNAPVATVVEGAGISFDYDIALAGNKINGTGGPITGTIDLTGTATPSPTVGFDYTNTSSFGFSIPNGAGTTSVTINVFNDTLVEAPETVIGTISGLNFGSPDPSNNDVTVTILDDDAGGIFISIGSPTDTTESNSGSPFVSFRVFIEGGGLNTTGSPITGNITYSGTATPTLDFTPVSSFSIPIGSNDVIVQVPVVNNFVTEPTESVVAFLAANSTSSPTSPSTGSFANTSATAFIDDDDAASLGISIGSPTDGEEGISDVSFVISLDGGATNGTGSPIFGSISYGGTANAADFTGTLPTTFSIPNGQMQTTINLPVFDDAAVEYTETMIAIISSPSVGSITTDSSTANILDNDLGSLSISIDTIISVGTEGGTNDIIFRVSMDGGLTNGLGTPLTGSVLFTGDATPGSDFSNSGTFAIPEGSSFVDHVLAVIDDPNIEIPQEMLIATLSNPLIPGTINSSADTDTAYIIDNDLAGATLQINATLNGVEAPAPSFVNPVFTVSFTGGLQNFTGTPITGGISYSGTAIEGVDYQGIATFTIPDSSGVAIIELPIIDDPLEEVTETIIATITSTTLGTIGATNSATADLVDDDTDSDNDGLPNLTDPNTGNIDSDCDGIFDGCDADADGDGVLDVGAVDTDGDGINDECDVDIDGDGIIDNGPDINNDGLNDVAWDPTDDDEDLLPNHVDPIINNPDSDGDGIPDGADADVNGDGILDNGCDDDLDGIHNIADADTPGNTDLDGSKIDDKWDVGLNTERLINYIVSPNNDGVNDVFKIKGLQFVKRYDLQIFNRWGTQVFQTFNYQGNWDGTANQDGVETLSGEPLAEGTYFYILDVVVKGDGSEGDTFIVKGYIELRR